MQAIARSFKYQSYLRARILIGGDPLHFKEVPARLTFPQTDVANQPKPKYVPRVGSKKNSALTKFLWEWAGFRKYGLMFEDLYGDCPELIEAIKRLPADVYDARIARIDRAFQLTANHDILPREQWTKFEDDVKYLEPYLEEVRREFAERDAYYDNNKEVPK